MSVSQNAYCTNFLLALDTYSFANIAVTQNFQTAMEQLPQTFDSRDSTNTQSFLNFFNEFGTHIVTSLTLGGRVSRTSQFTSSSWTLLQSSSTSIQASASASFSVYSVGVSGTTSSQQSLANSFDSAVSTTTQAFLGGTTTFTPSGWATWSSTISSAPQPVQYTLTNIFELVSAKGYTNQAAALEQATEAYCGLTPGCINTPLACCAIWWNVYGSFLCRWRFFVCK